MAGPTLTISWSEDALADLGRFADFLQETAPNLASSIAYEIIARTRLLGQRPLIGRPVSGTAYREFVIRALNAAYVVRYRTNQNRVFILRVFHRRERRM